MKITIKLFCLFLVARLLLSCNKIEPENYLIPEDYKGRVNIIFDQKKGANIRYENGRRVYEVPASGILLTQFKDEYGISDHNYFYVDKTGKKTKLRIFKFIYNKDGTTKWLIENPLEIGVFLDGTTGAYGGNSEIKFQEFLISDYKSLDIFYTPEYKEKFENRLQNILERDFSPERLNDSEMDSIVNLLNRKRKSN